jgi:hypothetical protein
MKKNFESMKSNKTEVLTLEELFKIRGGQQITHGQGGTSNPPPTKPK